MPPSNFPKIQQAVAGEAERLIAPDDPRGSVVALTELIAFLQLQLTSVTVRRDELLGPLLSDAKSNRSLAAELGLSRQRIDQLAKISAAGRQGATPPGNEQAT